MKLLTGKHWKPNSLAAYLLALLRQKGRQSKAVSFGVSALWGPWLLGLSTSIRLAGESSGKVGQGGNLLTVTVFEPIPRDGLRNLENCLEKADPGWLFCK